MAAPKKPGGNAGKGRKPGVPNKLTADVKAMVLGALHDAGGQRYLLRQANENPRAFLALLGRIIPLQVTGADGKDLIPPDPDPSRVALALLAIVEASAARTGEAQDAGKPETAIRERETE